MEEKSARRGAGGQLNSPMPNLDIPRDALFLSFSISLMSFFLCDALLPLFAELNAYTCKNTCKAVCCKNICKVISMTNVIIHFYEVIS